MKNSSAYDASSHDASESESMSVDTALEPPTRKSGKVQIAGAENNLVFWIRMIVLAVLVVSTVSVVLAVCFCTSDSEEDDFEKGFISYSLKVLDRQH